MGTEAFEFKSLQDILEELEQEKKENKRLHDIIDENITSIWEAIDLNIGATYENSMGIDKNAQGIEEIDIFDISVEKLLNELNETDRALFDANSALNDSLTNTAKFLMDADDVLSESIESGDQTLSSSLSQEEEYRKQADEGVKKSISEEETNREQSDQQLESKISEVNGDLNARIDAIENTVVMTCSTDTECGDNLYCIEGMCSISECRVDKDCGSNNICDTQFRLCYIRHSGYSCNGSYRSHYGSLSQAFEGCSNDSECGCVYYVHGGPMNDPDYGTYSSSTLESGGDDAYTKGR